MHSRAHIHSNTNVDSKQKRIKCAPQISNGTRPMGEMWQPATSMCQFYKMRSISWCSRDDWQQQQQQQQNQMFSLPFVAIVRQLTAKHSIACAEFHMTHSTTSMCVCVITLYFCDNMRWWWWWWFRLQNPHINKQTISLRISYRNASQNLEYFNREEKWKQKPHSIDKNKMNRMIALLR